MLWMILLFSIESGHQTGISDRFYESESVCGAALPALRSSVSYGICVPASGVSSDMTVNGAHLSSDRKRP